MRRLVCRSLPFVVLAAVPIVLQACGSGGSDSVAGGGPGGSGGSAGSDGGTTDGGTDASAGGSDGGQDGSLLDQHTACTSGEPCGDGGVCAGGTCCEAPRACGEACCGSGEVCSFQKCVAPGADCTDSTECAAGEYCEYSLGDPADGGANDAGTDGGTCIGGSVPLSGKCLPRPPECAADAGAPDGGPLDCLEKCEWHPTGPSFNPVLKYAWGGKLTAPFDTDVMMTPIVVELDDDDCDGKITARDIPEIVFSTFASGQYTSAGRLHAISIVGGQVVDKWTVDAVVNPTKQLAGGDIDGKPGNEVVACGVDGAVHAFDGAGQPFWTSAPTACFMPSIADLDGDGAPEVVVEGGILDGATGALKHAFSAPLASSFVVSDIDGDHELDVVTGSQAFHADGTLFVDTQLADQSQFYATSDWKSPWPAVADLDHTGLPEIVVVDNLAHALSVWRYDASAPGGFDVVRAPIDINAKFASNGCTGWGASHGGGPPTIADFDGDGTPDVALAGGIGYVVFGGGKLVDPGVAGPDAILWDSPTVDCSSASTGSTVFDFDGDGKAEVVYSDENHLRIYEGATGNVLVSTCNTTATLIENPVVADVDNDGHADIVVVSNAYGQNDPALQCDDGNGLAQSGVRIFGDAAGSWVRTRRVWNEHAYHVTNVNEDGTIPQHEAWNWTQSGLNDFRQNKQPGSEFAAPNAIVSLAVRCTGAYGLAATVRNVGQAALPAGVVVGFYAGTPPSGTSLGTGATTKTLYPAESEVVFLPLPNAPAGVVNGTTPVYAVVDDGGAPHPSWQECKTDDDTSAAVSAKCNGPH